MGGFVKNRAASICSPILTWSRFFMATELPVRESFRIKKLLYLQEEPLFHRLSHAEQRVDFFGMTLIVHAAPSPVSVLPPVLLPAEHALIIPRYQKKLFSPDSVKISTMRAKTSVGCCIFKVLTGICAMPILCTL